MLVFTLVVSFRAFPEGMDNNGPRRTSELLAKLLSREISDEQWLASEKEFESLPPRIALPVLFPEVAKRIPGGWSYAAYNCFEPLHDRKAGGWGEYCVVNWLWCKQLGCLQKHDEVSRVLLGLWEHPISYWGQMALLQALCSNTDSEARIAALFRDISQDVRLRTEAAACLLSQQGWRYKREVVTFAEQATTRFDPPHALGTMSYSLNLKERLFEQLADIRHLSEIDPAVVRLGFGLLLDEADRQRKANESGVKASYYGQFLYANRLSQYLGITFAPSRARPIYQGTQGNEPFWQDTAVNALDWWSRNRKKYAASTASRKSMSDIGMLRQLVCRLSVLLRTTL